MHKYALPMNVLKIGQCKLQQLTMHPNRGGKACMPVFVRCNIFSVIITVLFC